VDEVQEARILMARATRHREWPVPRVSLDEVSGTIKVRPAPAATYIPSKWTFELDDEAVLQRLITDMYSEPSAFIRELLQNAFDAHRSQMYADLVKDGLKAPEYPTQVDEGRRVRYPVKVGLATKDLENSLSGEIEQRQILIVEDCGIGMDQEIIQRYFLQVGRSYYTTDEFRRNFGFIPTSRFGLGFLSVFAVSDHVAVETYKPSSPNQDGPVRLTLTAPRNYLLMERGKRRTNGTRIEVLLREQMEPGELTKRVSRWCRRVEFPIIVDDLGTLTTINSERPEQLTYETPIVTKEGARFAVRAFPTNRPSPLSTMI
jgi:HSP90 family molecular chaperone